MNEDGSNRNRPLIGIMTGSFHTDYSRQITEAVSNRLKAEGMDVCLFQGLDASRFLNIDGYVDAGFDRHYYSQFEYSRFIRPDILIVSFSTISAVNNPLGLSEFRSILPDVPLIVFETDEEIPNGMHILPDNYEGMAGCVGHLIHKHGLKKIFFVSGLRGVKDADIRLRAYLDTMAENGLEVTADMVKYGNFTDQVDDLIEEILCSCERPDAIVCSNDEMAESAYRVLKAHGLIPGRDVAVTGFDDNTAARFMDPPLTSVSQSKEEIASKVLETVMAFLRGETPSSVTLPAQLIVRGSCGCGSALSDGSELSESFGGYNRAMKYRETVKRLSHESMLLSLLLRNLLAERISVHDYFTKLGEALNRLGAEYSWAALLEEPMTVTGESRLRLPDTLRLHMVQEGDSVRSWSRREAPTVSASDPELVRSLIHDQTDDLNDAVFPLFYGSSHYGVFVARVKMEEMLFYYNVSLQIGTGLRYLFMALDDQEARAALEVKNRILDFSASHDPLTGLFNRAGVANRIYDYIQEKGPWESYVALAADLDHLKQINDTFGHGLGDHAIQKAAEILKAVLPEGTPLGRSGGDEFVALVHADDDGLPERLRREIKDSCRAYNDLNDVPCYVEISVGCHLFRMGKDVDVPAMIALADEDLYLDKKGRRASVLREK